MEKKGFTLIELLVVISIIALLLSILMPSLQKVKELASGIVCMSNQKSLALSWMMYAGENNGKVVGGYILNSNDERNNPIQIPSWAIAPLSYDGNGNMIPENDYDTITLEHRLNGLREGALFTYLENTDVYHCPGDQRAGRGTNVGSSPGHRIYRSYSMPHSMATNIDPDAVRALGYMPIKKTTMVNRPSSKYIFIEEAYDGWFLPYNDQSWSFRPYNSDGTFRYELWDPLGQFHVKSCTFAFADGHTEKHKWQDKRTLDYFEWRAATGSNHATYIDNVDIEFLAKAFPYVPAQ